MAKAKNIPEGVERAKKFYQEGLAYLARRRFNDALEILEQALQQDSRDPEIHVKMGTAALYLDYLEEAKRYYERALQLDRDNAEAMNGLAFIALRGDDATEATNLVCDVLRIKPHHRKAKKIFEDLNHAESIEGYIAGIHPDMFVSLPSKLYAFSESRYAKPLRYVSIFIIMAGIIIIMIYNWDLLVRRKGWNMDIPGITQSGERDIHYPSNLPANTDIGRSLRRALASGEEKGEARLLSEREASRLVTRIKQLINSQEYNESRYLYNKLKSGAEDPVTRQIAEKVKDFIRFPDPESLHFNPQTADIVENPGLYKRVAVKWFSKTVQKTNEVLLQIAPARYHTGEGRAGKNVRVFAVSEDMPDIGRGRNVEIFGEVLGVDKGSKKEPGIIFLKLHNMKRMR